MSRAAGRARHAVRGALALGAALAVAAASACAPARQPPPHLLLVVIDALRADHLGAYGYPRATSPAIDALAREGLLFEMATATSSWTRPSVGSLFTSRRPSEHGAVSFRRPLDPAHPTLAEGLRSAGYHTLGVSGNFVHVSEETGFARGFERFETVRKRSRSQAESIWDREKRGERVYLRAPRGRELNREVLRWLPPAGEAPLFLYVHYMEPHAPLAPPEAFRRALGDGALQGPGLVSSGRLVALAFGEAHAGPDERRHIVDLYDAEVAAVDAALAELLAALAERGYGDDLVAVVTADHGEEFGEHGGWFHGLALHRESIAVPLVLHGPGRIERGVRRSDGVDLLDVAPTLLRLAGAPVPPAMRGRDLLAASLPARDRLAELREDPAALAPRQRLALLRGPWKVLVPVRGEPQIYHLERDPNEREPERADPSHPAHELVARALALAAGPGPDPGGEAAPLDADALEELRALGYAR